MKISMQELNEMKPSIVHGNTSIYTLDDSTIAKRFRFRNANKKNNYYKKAQYALQMSEIKRLQRPIDILETERGFCGYIEHIIPGTHEKSLTSFTDYYNLNRHQITLREINDYILQVIGTIRECHANDIVNPDICSEGNVLYNILSKEVYLTDFQGMQVKDISTDDMSDFYVGDPILMSEKYSAHHLWSPNLDWYIIAIRYLYYTTKINLPRAVKMNVPLEDILKMANLSQTSFGECIRILYDPEKDNLDFSAAIAELGDEYDISPFVQGRERQFIKK